MFNQEIKSGKSETKRINNSLETKEEKKFLKFNRVYQGLLKNVSISIKTLEIITKNNEQNHLFREYCPSFCSAMTYNFWAQSVIGLHICFYGQFSFNKLIDYIKANWNKIYTSIFERTITWNDGTITKNEIVYDQKYINDQLKKINAKINNPSNRIIIEKIKWYRDKVYSHIDDCDSFYSLHLQELRKIFILAEEIYNIIFSMYNNSHLFIEPINSDDIKNVINTVNTYETYHKEINELRKQMILKEMENI